MRDSNIYIPLWQKYKSAIVNKMKLACIEKQEYPMSKHEFEALGDRNRSGYSFNLELKNGSVANDIGGSAVARDLFEVLRQSNAAKELMVSNAFKINLTKDFTLVIQTI